MCFTRLHYNIVQWKFPASKVRVGRYDVALCTSISRVHHIINVATFNPVAHCPAYFPGLGRLAPRGFLPSPSLGRLTLGGGALAGGFKVVGPLPVVGPLYSGRML